MKRTNRRAVPAVALLAAVLSAGFAAPAAFAGGAACKEQHTQASYDKMRKEYAAHGWLGIETEKAGEGRYAITTVALGSPAEKAGFRKGDVLVAINGASFAGDKEKVKQAKSSLAPGRSASYTVVRDGAERQLTATLGEVPPEVLAKWVDEHKTAHANDTVAAN